MTRKSRLSRVNFNSISRQRAFSLRQENRELFFEHNREEEHNSLSEIGAVAEFELQLLISIVHLVYYLDKLLFNLKLQSHL